MAKKRFTDDLFGLFEDPQEAATPEPQAPATPPAVEKGEETVEVKVPAASSKARKKLSSKNFTADLDDFLSDSFEREANAGKSPKPAPAAAPQNRPRSRRRKTGLDLLIRSTVADEDRSPKGGNTADTKRVTLIFNKQHLAELKEQAKERGMYLKDVVQEMVSNYLEK
ncbi:MAG: hypothetical protein AAGA31_16610 [Bacteroidota bacterium]